MGLIVVTIKHFVIVLDGIEKLHLTYCNVREIIS